MGARLSISRTSDAETLLGQVAKTIDSLFARFPESALRIELISISCFWHSLMGVDTAGNATTPVLGWADSRAVDAVYQLRSEFDEKNSRTHRLPLSFQLLAGKTAATANR